ncbi:hypothetical protein LguiA_008081 [Lonicera macranthoides]
MERLHYHALFPDRNTVIVSPDLKPSSLYKLEMESRNLQLYTRLQMRTRIKENVPSENLDRFRIMKLSELAWSDLDHHRELQKP